MRALVLAPLAALLLSGCAAGGLAAPEPPPVAGPPGTAQRQAAEQGLAAFRLLVTPQNYARLGFASVDEVQRAQLAPPLPIFRVELDALRRYTPNAAPETVMVDARRSLYPLVVDDHVPCGLIVTGRPDGWRATDFGKAALTRDSAALRRGPQDVLVQIPAAQVNFLARGSGEGLALIPIRDDPRFGFKRGATLAAARALGLVRRGMEGYNGLPE